MRELLRITISLALLGAVFWLLETLFPSRPGQLKWRRGIKTDLMYWVFTPLVTKFITRFAVGALVLLGVVAVLGREAVPHIATQGYGPVSTWPSWLQAIGAFVIGDFIGYWMHRLFHGARLWPFHAIHHSSTEVDWLSAVRLHPVNDVLARVAQAVPLLLLGFPATVLAVYVPFISFYAILLHANVSWSFGPLRYVLSSPCFHRWHHTTEREGLDKNFAGFFPLWDLLFGTFYMPRDKQPETFGVLRNDVPQGLLGQLWYPFQSKTGHALPVNPTGDRS